MNPLPAVRRRPRRRPRQRPRHQDTAALARRRRRLVAAGPATLLVLAVIAIVTTLAALRGVSPPSMAVIAAVPYWNTATGNATVQQYRSVFTEISPWSYGLGPDGRVVPQAPPEAGEAAGGGPAPGGAGPVETGLPVVASVANVTDGAWAYQPVADILHDPVRRDRHVAELVDLARAQNYAGIDIDYEDLRAADRSAFSAFVEELADGLHANGLTLSVAVFGKENDAGYDERNLAQDYAVIGAAADQVRLMTYDYHWSTSPPGPVAPVGWVRGVLDYARSQVPDRKIVMGVPVSGYDWVDGQGSVVSWADASRLALAHGAAVTLDPASRTPWFRYTDQAGRFHEVWFEDADSTTAKVSLARQAGVGGICFWLNGVADGRTWTWLHETATAGTGQEADR